MRVDWILLDWKISRCSKPQSPSSILEFSIRSLKTHRRWRLTTIPRAPIIKTSRINYYQRSTNRSQLQSTRKYRSSSQLWWCWISRRRFSDSLISTGVSLRAWGRALDRLLNPTTARPPTLQASPISRCKTAIECKPSSKMQCTRIRPS